MARSSAMLSGPRRRARVAPQPMPTRIQPMLAVLSQRLPADESNWSFEYKWDGVRALCYWDGRRMLLHSRNLLDITRRYPELHELGSALGKAGVILDGEILALDDDGRPSFPRLQRRMHAEGAEHIGRLTREVPVWYVLFDVLYANGQSTMDLPYTRRREILESLTVAGPAWQITPAHTGDGEAMLRAAERVGMEGVVAKRLDSVYEPGRRSPAWLKIKVVFGQELVIGGWVPEKGENRSRVGALLMGYYECPRDSPPKLRYAGKVGTGFNSALHASLTRLLEHRGSPVSPFVDKVPKPHALWVRPELVAEVQYRRWPEGGQIQQASFKGLRADKKPTEVVKELQGGSF